MLAMALSNSIPNFDAKTSPIETLLQFEYPLQPGHTFQMVVEQSIAFVARDRSVADAKSAMENTPNCQDVIVTEHGLRAEPVLGWISNVDIGRISQA
jgi:hypothetical protein